MYTNFHDKVTLLKKKTLAKTRTKKPKPTGHSLLIGPAHVHIIGQSLNTAQNSSAALSSYPMDSRHY